MVAELKQNLLLIFSRSILFYSTLNPCHPERERATQGVRASRRIPEIVFQTLLLQGVLTMIPTKSFKSIVRTPLYGNYDLIHSRDPSTRPRVCSDSLRMTGI